MNYDANLETLVGSEVDLLGFDTGVSDALMSAVALMSEDNPLLKEAPRVLDDDAFEGVLSLRIDGEDVALILHVDPSDGYRSHLGPVLRSPVDAAICQFKNHPRRVRIENVVPNKYGTVEGMVVVDVETSHVWLEFGTDNSDDYYPTGYVRWHPL